MEKDKNTTLAVTIQYMILGRRNEDGIYIACDSDQQLSIDDLDQYKLDVTQVLVSRMTPTDGKMEHILVHNVDGDEALDLIKVLTGHKDI